MRVAVRVFNLILERYGKYGSTCNKLTRQVCLFPLTLLADFLLIKFVDRYQLNVQISITRAEEQHTRMLLTEAQMKALSSNLDQKTAHLMQRNEQLTERNTQLEEKNATYSMEIESLREENGSHAREITRVRADRDAATRAHALVGSKLELVHAELAMVANNSLLNKLATRKPSSPLLYHRQNKRYSSLLGINNAEYNNEGQDQQEGFILDHAGDSTEERTGGGSGAGGVEVDGGSAGGDGNHSAIQLHANDVQSAQQLYIDFMSFSRTLQDERYAPSHSVYHLFCIPSSLILYLRHKFALEQREITQQLSNILQIISLVSSHHRELVVRTLLL